MNCIFLENYKILKKVEINSIFDIYEAVDLTGNKIIIKSAWDNFYLSNILTNEYEQLIKLNGRHVPKVLEFIDRKILILEFIHGMNLKKIRERYKLEWTKIRDIFFKLLKLINYLHENNIVHGNIKPENIIYNNDIFLINFESFIKINEKKDILNNSNKDNLLINKKSDCLCLYETFLYLLKEKEEINYNNIPLKVKIFIKKWEENKSYEITKLLELWNNLNL